MSKSIFLIVSEAAKFYRENMGLSRTLKQEAMMEKTKISYEPLSFEVFDRPQIEFQGEGGYPNNLQLPAGLQETGDTGALTPEQREGLKTLGHLCGEMGYRVELGEIEGTVPSSGKTAIPVYITIDDNHTNHIFTHGDYAFARNHPLPEFKEVEFTDHYEQGIKALPSFEEGLTIDSLFDVPITRVGREKVRIRRNGGGHA